MVIEELKASVSQPNINTLTIKPALDESSTNNTNTNDNSPIKDNSIYSIIISNLVDKESGETIPPQKIDITTAYKPMYCTLESLKLLVDSYNIPENNMRSYIRDASKYADYVAGGKAVKDGQPVPFPVEEFVRTQAILNCLMRTFMDRSVSAGNKYKLDVAEYQDSVNTGAFKDLLGALRKELQKWQDAIRGYFPEGRCKPKVTRIGIKSGSNSDVSYTTVDGILQDITRTVPQWS